MLVLLLFDFFQPSQKQYDIIVAFHVSWVTGKHECHSYCCSVPIMVTIAFWFVLNGSSDDMIVVSAVLIVSPIKFNILSPICCIFKTIIIPAGVVVYIQDIVTILIVTAAITSVIPIISIEFLYVIKDVIGEVNWCIAVEIGVVSLVCHTVYHVQNLIQS